MKTKKIVLGLLVLTMLLIVACTEDTPTEPYDVNGETTPSEEDTETQDADTNDTDNMYEEDLDDTEETDIEDTDDENGADTQDADETNGEETAEGITREQIAENNNEESCWVGYYGYVYDLTSWLNQHPGGADEILPHCGTVEEFTEAYDARHGQKDELNRNQAIAQLV